MMRRSLISQFSLFFLSIFLFADSADAQARKVPPRAKPVPQASPLPYEVTITPDMESFPPGFAGHSIEEVLRGLGELLKREPADSKAFRYERIYGKLTAGDTFAFLPNVFGEKGSLSVENSDKYSWIKFPLLSRESFPSPLVSEVRADGGASSVAVSKAKPPKLDDITQEYEADGSIVAMWQRSYLPLRTDAPEPADANALNKKCRAPKDATSPPVCEENVSFRVAPRQVHYGLAFTTGQNHKLIYARHESFDPATNYFSRKFMPGLIAWTENGPKYGGKYEPIFIVRLTAPYVASKDFSVDSKSGEAHAASLKLFFVELAGIWIYDRETGRIISKEGGVMEPPRSEEDVFGGGPSSPIKFLKRPHPEFPSLAKKMGVRGKVRLRVTFLKNGVVGPIEVLYSLPYGATEAAIEAARKIIFTPEIRNGKPVTVTKILEYTFIVV